VAHCSALADLRFSTASFASTKEVVASTLARFAPGTSVKHEVCVITRDAFARR
jgi:hypothetical protein